MPENPFTPSFGEVPQIMAGRRHILRKMRRALESPSRRPELTTLISGARGTGKTALLSSIGDEAAQRGWLVVEVTALPGMLDDIYERAIETSREYLPAPETHLTGVTIGSLIGVDWERDQPVAGNWRTKMNKLLDTLGERNVGLLINVDEVRPELDEMRQLAATYQHFTREHRRVALIMAGLPYNVARLTSDKSVSFLRRASRIRLGRIPDGDVRDALRQTFQVSEKIINDEALDYATNAIGGFAFMIQLVGYHMWERAIGIPTITRSIALQGAHDARQEMDDQILSSTYDDLSDMDVAFLTAMLADRAESRMSDIAERMGKTYTYAAQYRKRLLEAGIISERGRGKVGFELPFFREYLDETLEGEAILEETDTFA